MRYAVRILMNMDRSLRSVFTKATNLATASLSDVAGGLGRVLRTVQMYRAGHRRVTPDAARALAAYLRARAEAFMKAAGELEQAAKKEEVDE